MKRYNYIIVEELVKDLVKQEGAERAYKKLKFLDTMIVITNTVKEARYDRETDTITINPMLRSDNFRENLMQELYKKTKRK